jgi:hypothetical protein
VSWRPICETFGTDCCILVRGIAGLPWVNVGSILRRRSYFPSLFRRTQKYSRSGIRTSRGEITASARDSKWDATRTKQCSADVRANHALAFRNPVMTKLSCFSVYDRAGRSLFGLDPLTAKNRM